MNPSSLIGILIGLGVVVASLRETGMDTSFFLNFHGLVIVCGGTLAAAAISFPVTKLLTLFRVVAMGLFERTRL